MSSASTKIEKKKISITLETYEKLKVYSRHNGLKLRMVIDAMVDVILEDDELSNRVIGLADVNEETIEE